MEKNPKVKEKSLVISNTTTIRKPAKQYSDFLNSHYVKKEDNKPFTNARMPDKKNGKAGASYHIDENEYQEFLKMYAKEIIVKNIPDHLTELQLDNNGPILVDLDFHY